VGQLVTVDIDQLRAMVEALAERAAREAIARAKADTPMVTQITAVVNTVDGADAYVVPADDSAAIIQATRLHPDIVAGSTVWLVQSPPAGAFVLGPIPH
jgi:hypothetical protein